MAALSEWTPLQNAEEGTLSKASDLLSSDKHKVRANQEQHMSGKANFGIWHTSAVSTEAAHLHRPVFHDSAADLHELLSRSSRAMQESTRRHPKDFNYHYNSLHPQPVRLTRHLFQSWVQATHARLFQTNAADTSISMFYRPSCRCVSFV